MGDKKDDKKDQKDKKKNDKKDKKDVKDKKKNDKKNKKDQKKDKKDENNKKKEDKKKQKNKKKENAKQKKNEKMLDKTLDFECTGEPITHPWFQNKGHWECEDAKKGRVCAYVCNYNVSKSTTIYCDNGQWMDSSFAHEKCL